MTLYFNGKLQEEVQELPRQEYIDPTTLEWLPSPHDGWWAKVYTVQIGSRGLLDIPSLNSIEKCAPLSSQDHRCFFYIIRYAGLPSDVPLQSGVNETALTGRTLHCLTEHH